MAASSLVDLPNGERVHYRVDGREGAPWLTLSNSLVTDLTLWDEFVAALGDRYRILRLDQRGHGGSPPSKVAYDIPALAEDVVALWDRLGIRRSHAVGVSMGGGVTLALAIRHGDRLLSCVPCDCRADFTPTRRDWEPRLAKARAEGVAAMAEPTVSRWFTPASMEAGLPVIDRIRRMIAETPLAGYEGGINALVTTNLSAGIPSIDVPTMLVVGEKDGMVEAIHALARQIRGSSLVVIKDCGHLPMVERPVEYARAVGAFLDSITARGIVS